MSAKVDVVINVYGKPYQTAVTLFSLEQHSGNSIGKIYFIEEKKQPYTSDFSFIYKYFGDKLIRFRPKFWLWVNKTNKMLLNFKSYRHSVRYQYAWEKSDKDFLFITHNDVLYKGDIVETFLSNIGEHIGIGEVGQCWNCPAAMAKLCSSENYLNYQPSFTELKQLIKDHPPKRPHFKKFISEKQTWPLPECRLNEWVTLINLKKARPLTMPYGPAFPFGAYKGLDLATQWFQDMHKLGHTVKHFDFTSIAHHAWTNATNGHSAMFDKNIYDEGELIAREKLVSDFNIIL